MRITRATENEIAIRANELKPVDEGFCVPDSKVFTVE